MKRQNKHANSAQDRVKTIFSRSEVLNFALFGPKIGFLRVVSSHPLTLREPD